MRLLFFLFCLPFFILSCDQDKNDPAYTGRELEYELFPASQEYAYNGRVSFKELVSSEIELTIQLSGNKGNEPYFFPAHLHFGAYDAPGPAMAAMLNPVDIRNLKSVTLLDKLTNGDKLSFDAISQFDGHVKVHLSAEGPDYLVILVAGNIGSNQNNTGGFDMGNIKLCSPY